MSRLVLLSFAVFAILAAQPRLASAVVVEKSVTPASIRQEDKRFSVSAEKREDGLIHFTLTYRPTGPRYLVCHVEIRDADEVILKSDTPTYVREGSATFYLAVSPKRLPGTRLEIAERSFVETDGKPVPMPGGIDYQIQLAEFAKEVAKKPG